MICVFILTCSTQSDTFQQPGRAFKNRIMLIEFFRADLQPKDNITLYSTYLSTFAVRSLFNKITEVRPVIQGLSFSSDWTIFKYCQHYWSYVHFDKQGQCSNNKSVSLGAIIFILALLFNGILHKGRPALGSLFSSVIVDSCGQHTQCYNKTALQLIVPD